MARLAALLSCWHPELPMPLSENILEPAAIDAGERRALIRLVNAAFRRHAWLFPDDRIGEEGFQLETAGKQLLVLRSTSGELAAMAVLELCAPVLRFGMAVVAPELQGRGIGASLVARLEALARAARLERVEMETVVEIGNAH